MKKISAQPKTLLLIAAALTVLFASAFQNAAPASAARLSDINPLQTSLSLANYPAMLCEASMFVKDVTIDDWTKMKPNTAFIKKWRVKNVGACGWNKKYSLQFVSGDRLSGEAVHLTKWVPFGKAVTVSVNLVAPNQIGKYTGYWILTNSNGTPIGSYLTVKIIVAKKVP